MRSCHGVCRRAAPLPHMRARALQAPVPVPVPVVSVSSPISHALALRPAVRSRALLSRAISRLFASVPACRSPAMMCSIFESIAYNARGTDDVLNPAGAAALTGTLYKITSGPKVAVPFAVGLGAAVGTGSFVTKQLSKAGMFKSFF